MKRLIGALQAIIIDNCRAIADLREEGRRYLCDVETNWKMLASVLRDAARLIDVSAEIGLAIASLNEIGQGNGENPAATLPPGVLLRKVRFNSASERHRGSGG